MVSAAYFITIHSVAKLVFVEMLEISVVGTGLRTVRNNRLVLRTAEDVGPYSLKPKNIHTRQGITCHFVVGRGLAPAVRKNKPICFGRSKPLPYDYILTVR